MLWIDFDELVEAFDFCSENLHFFIDLEKDKILSIDKMQEDAEKECRKIKERKHIEIPIKESKDELNIMESFVYEMQEENFDLADKFHKVLEKKNQFTNFKELIKKQGEELEMKWYKFREKEFRNNVINWLCQNDFELSYGVIPKVEIKELNREEAENVIDELKDFWPITCMNCNNKKNLKQIFFLLNVPVENALIEEEVKKILKEKYDFEHYGYYVGERTVIVSSKCPVCGSEEIFWDY